MQGKNFGFMRITIDVPSDLSGLIMSNDEGWSLSILTQGGAGGRPEWLHTGKRGDHRSDLLPYPISNRRSLRY